MKFLCFCVFVKVLTNELKKHEEMNKYLNPKIAIEYSKEVQRFKYLFPSLVILDADFNFHHSLS